MAKTKKTKRRPKAKARASSKSSKKSAKRSSARKTPRKAPAASRGRGKKATAKSRKRKPAPRKARRPIAKPVAKKAKRLPPRKRHAVENDESRERVGDAEGEAFVGVDTTEDEAKELGEEFVRSVTSGEEAESEMEEEETTEEQGGPFVVTSASTEYGFGTDESNPADAEKAPFPQVSPAVVPKGDGEDGDQ